MSKSSSVLNVDGEYNFPRGFTISDNRIEDIFDRLLVMEDGHIVDEKTRSV